MKNVKTVAIAAIFYLASFGRFAAEQIVHPVNNQQAIGVVSASGALTLSGLESKLARWDFLRLTGIVMGAVLGGFLLPGVASTALVSQKRALSI